VIQFLPLAWDTYQTLAQKLAAAILDQKTPVDQIVAISRGGLTLGHLLSDYLQVPISIVGFQSYTNFNEQGTVKILEKLQIPLRGKHILIADDVADTGKTFTHALKYIGRFKPKSVTTAAMFYKPHSVFRPDYFAGQTSKWIIFPHDLIETAILISKNMEKEEKTKVQIQAFLKRLHYSDSQIEFVRRHHLH
jgi:hypoxanthine phosphoribosyltransferase